MKSVKHTKWVSAAYLIAIGLMIYLLTGQAMEKAKDPCAGITGKCRQITKNYF